MPVINAVVAENALNTVTPGLQLYSKIEANDRVSICSCPCSSTSLRLRFLICEMGLQMLLRYFMRLLRGSNEKIMNNITSIGLYGLQHTLKGHVSLCKT